MLGYENENENGNANENDIDMHCVIEHHNAQYAPVDAISNRDNERSQPKSQRGDITAFETDAKVPKRQNNGERDAEVLVGHGGGG
jgi:hypothetical protein